MQVHRVGGLVRCGGVESMLRVCFLAARSGIGEDPVPGASRAQVSFSQSSKNGFIVDSGHDAHASRTVPFRFVFGSSQAIFVTNVPMDSIETSIRSPAASHTGGLRKAPIPAGVPVVRTSPGSKVMYWLT